MMMCKFRDKLWMIRDGFAWVDLSIQRHAESHRLYLAGTTYTQP